MHTRTVTLTEELERFISDQVQSGNYADENEVVRAALKRLEYEAEHYEERIAALNKALDDGEASGVAEGDVFERVRQKLGLSSA